MSDPDDFDSALSRTEERLSGVEAAVDELEESISGVEDELRKLRGDMDRGFDGMKAGFEQQHRQMRRLLFLFGLYITVLLVLVELL